MILRRISVHKEVVGHSCSESWVEDSSIWRKSPIPPLFGSSFFSFSFFGFCFSFFFCFHVLSLIHTIRSILITDIFKILNLFKMLYYYICRTFYVDIYMVGEKGAVKKEVQQIFRVGCKHIKTFISSP